MTNGQIQQLQDLQKCYISDEDNWRRVNMWLVMVERNDWSTNLPPRWVHPPKDWLRTLTHQYRNQIKAMKRNQVAE